LTTKTYLDKARI